MANTFHFRGDFVEFIYSSVQVSKHMINYLEQRSPGEESIAWCKILTYGMWVGIDNYGNVKWKSATYRLLKLLEEMGIRTTIVVGISEANGTTPSRIEVAQKRFSHFNIIPVENLHAKCMLFSDGYCMLGSCNLGDSEWEELAWVGYLNTDQFRELDGYIGKICIREVVGD